MITTTHLRLYVYVHVAAFRGVTAPICQLPQPWGASNGPACKCVVHIPPLSHLTHTSNKLFLWPQRYCCACVSICLNSKGPSQQTVNYMIVLAVKNGQLKKKMATCE